MTFLTFGDFDSFKLCWSGILSLPYCGTWSDVFFMWLDWGCGFGGVADVKCRFHHIIQGTSIIIFMTGDISWLKRCISDFFEVNLLKRFFFI